MAAFPATRHSLVAAIRGDQPGVRRAAFDTLVAAYWKPVFKYLRLKWRVSEDDAADLTQAFFLKAFEKDFFVGFDPGRARFRTYLRTCLDGFAANSRKADARLKRGGQVTTLSIDAMDFREAEHELRHQAANAVADFDEYFHREWLRGLFATATARLCTACRDRGRTERFSLFEAYDLAAADVDRPTYAALARRHGLSATDVTNELAAARREFRRLVIEALREQCASEAEFEAEVQALTR
jgi:DNA-directed RNA polymerase specialized sigma24 family protein